jgi:DNA (cytosine-5)-methyltransferase 1
MNKGDPNVAIYTVVSLFSGIGGLDLGVRDVLQTRTICYVEREIKAARILAERASEGLLDEAPIYSDVKTFPTELFAENVEIDFLIGGFPCQPFSVAGRQEGSDDERNLWPDTIRIIRELRPRYVFLENVPGLVAHPYFGTILGELAEAGYDAEWGCFKASDIGASHRRERLFILANATGTRLQGQEHWLSRDASKPSGELAHAERNDAWRGGYELEGTPSENQGAGHQRQRLRPDSGDGGNELAHANGLPEFPPAPGDSNWEWIVEHYPELAPAICKHGTPVRSGMYAPECSVRSVAYARKSEDRVAAIESRSAALMMLGNAVVPAQAAYALRELMKRVPTLAGHPLDHSEIQSSDAESRTAASG